MSGTSIFMPLSLLKQDTKPWGYSLKDNITELRVFYLTFQLSRTGSVILKLRLADRDGTRPFMCPMTQGLWMKP